jgi:hypothetical protein
MDDSPRNRIAGYLGALAVFTAGTVGTAVVGKLRGHSLPESFDPLDLAIGGVATFKFARLVSKDAVTTPLRAPFTEYEGDAGAGELNEKPRPGHPQHTIGELVTCPFCLAPWIATGYVAGLSLSPRLARTWAAVFSVVAASDTLQFAYARIRTE